MQSEEYENCVAVERKEEACHEVQKLGPQDESFVLKKLACRDDERDYDRYAVEHVSYVDGGENDELDRNKYESAITPLKNW